MSKHPDITFPCQRCDGANCRRCDGSCYLFARIDDLHVEIDGTRYDRGIERQERIDQAADMVDAWCREDLEKILSCP